MPSLFSRSGNRFASSGVIEILPSEVIDSIWFIIDADLQGFYELNDLLVFELINNFGNLTFRFSQKSEITLMEIDTKFGYSPLYPFKIFVGDDSNKQTIFLPKEFKT
ncbi:MAG: DUF960 domain-containing protein [Lactobacillales bacterium]|jgi:hypothetical protein|nr:DUF960 domain-containing protein [Lactobacillales bacterium]